MARRQKTENPPKQCELLFYPTSYPDWWMVISLKKGFRMANIRISDGWINKKPCFANGQTPSVFGEWFFFPSKLCPVAMRQEHVMDEVGALQMDCGCFATKNHSIHVNPGLCFSHFSSNLFS